MDDIAGVSKKHWLYIGGALASIVGLFWILKKSNTSSQMPVIQPARSSGGGASTDATSAAQVQAAAALAVEQGRERVALAQIASAEKIAGINAAAAVEAQRTGQSGATARAAIGAATTPGGQAAINAGAATANNLIKQLLNLFKGSPSPGQIQGPNIPAGWTYNEASGAWEQNGYIGNFGTIYDEPIGPMPDYFYGTIYEEPIGPQNDYTTTTGGGSSDWYGGGGLDEFTGEAFP